MRDAERSYGAMALLLVAAAVLGASLQLDWFQYEQTSGRRTPPAGLHDTSDLRAERHEASYRPFRQDGDAAPADPQGAAQAVQLTGIAVVAALACAAVAGLGELPGVRRLMPRWLGISLSGLAAAGALGALVVAWLLFPSTMGVAGPFTAMLDEPTYTRTTLWAGWAAAALAVPLALGALLLKYQAGYDDMQLPDGIVERRRGQLPAAAPAATPPSTSAEA